MSNLQRIDRLLTVKEIKANARNARIGFGRPDRAVFFSVREEYRNLINGASNNRRVLRMDAVVLKGERVGGRTGYLLRTDVQIITTHLGSETHTGLGDIYAQVLYIPYLSRKFAFVTGTGIVLPTATHKLLD